MELARSLRVIRSPLHFLLHEGNLAAWLAAKATCWIGSFLSVESGKDSFYQSARLIHQEIGALAPSNGLMGFGNGKYGAVC